LKQDKCCDWAKGILPFAFFIWREPVSIAPAMNAKMQHQDFKSLSQF
jgi:hypothetical protein